MLKHGILGLLAEGSMTGYEIYGVFTHSLSYFWKATRSQVYRELQYLEKNGYVTRDIITQDDKPDKKPYTITDKGYKELKEWLKTYHPRDIRSPLLMKTFFLSHLSHEEALQYFYSLLEEINTFITHTSTVPSDIKHYSDLIQDPDKTYYWMKTMEYGQKYALFEKEWIESCIKELEAKDENTYH